jgi:hypothetical protein
VVIDHLASTSLVVDADGNPLSRSRYTPFGKVAETQVWNGSAWELAEVPTDPIEQTDYLYQGDYLERELSIYFTVDGQYYDPWLGKWRFLAALEVARQPDPIGGPPLIPQAADRYQYAGNSPTSCSACGRRGAEFPTAEVIGVGKDVVFEVLGRSIRTGARLQVTASRTALTSGRYIPKGYQRVRNALGFNNTAAMQLLPDGRYVVTSAELSIGRAQVLESILQQRLPKGHGIGRGEVKLVYTTLDDLRWWNAADFGIDFVFGAGFQLMEDVGNPRLTPAQVWGRAGVAGVFGAVFSGLGGLAGGVVAGMVCGPGAPVCAVVIVVGGEFAGGWIWQRWLQPQVFSHPLLRPAPLNLKPLTAQ